jgi:hypothetical protein
MQTYSLFTNFYGRAVKQSIWATALILKGPLEAARRSGEQIDCLTDGNRCTKERQQWLRSFNLIVTSGLLDEIRDAAKQHKISVAQWVRAAIHRHLIESYKLNNVSKQKPEIINLVDVPVARWSRAEQEFADSVIQQHFEEDR